MSSSARYYAKYSDHPRFERINFLLRKGDSAILQSMYPGGASAWVRNMVAKHCDKILRERRKREREHKRQWAALTQDPNL